MVFFNMEVKKGHIIPLPNGPADNCVEDGEDNKSSSLQLFSPHDHLSYLQPQEIQLLNQIESWKRVAFACAVTSKM